jgi:hypothetical protein
LQTRISTLSTVSQVSPVTLVIQHAARSGKRRGATPRLLLRDHANFPSPHQHLFLFTSLPSSPAFSKPCPSPPHPSRYAPTQTRLHPSVTDRQ